MQITITGVKGGFILKIDDNVSIFTELRDLKYYVEKQIEDHFDK